MSRFKSLINNAGIEMKSTTHKPSIHPIPRLYVTATVYRVVKVTAIIVSSFKIANVLLLALGSTQMTFLYLLRCGGLLSLLLLPREYYLVLRV